MSTRYVITLKYGDAALWEAIGETAQRLYVEFVDGKKPFYIKGSHKRPYIDKSEVRHEIGSKDYWPDFVAALSEMNRTIAVADDERRRRVEAARTAFGETVKRLQ
ncbi:MAG: hypothetical protein ACR2OV_00070 [Hyphomicrobiaceae bacterium]